MLSCLSGGEGGGWDELGRFCVPLTIMPKLGGWIGEVTRMSRFDFGSGLDPDPASQWDAKRKLFSLVEVCAPPSAVLVCNATANTFMIMCRSCTLKKEQHDVSTMFSCTFAHQTIFTCYIDKRVHWTAFMSRYNNAVTIPLLWFQAVLIAFSSDFLPRLLYYFTATDSNSSYLEFILAYSPQKYVDETGTPCRWVSLDEQHCSISWSWCLLKTLHFFQLLSDVVAEIDTTVLAFFDQCWKGYFKQGLHNTLVLLNALAVGYHIKWVGHPSEQPNGLQYFVFSI